MKLVVGLGNPGAKYKNNRHNFGFLVTDALVTKFSAAGTQNKFDSELWEVPIDEQKVLVMQPQTFMNLSGQAVSAVMRFYKLNINDVLVVHDEVDLPLGQNKLSQGQSHAGHNGVKNIIEQLGDQNFWRLRLGVESRENRQIPPTPDFVLQNFSEEEQELLPKLIDQAASQIIDWVKK